MAKKNEKEDSLKLYKQILEDIRQRKFSKIYVLAGEEPYYSDVIIEALSSTVLSPSQKDFNYSVLYGTDTDAGQVVSLCRRYPVESDYQLIILKEAQQLSSLQQFEYYLAAPAPDTVLVLSFTDKSLDKRTTFYKKLNGVATVLESYALDEWKVPGWIVDYVKEQGYEIEADAAQLLAQSTGASLRKIVLEIDKLFKGIDTKTITVKDVEVNIGISRDFNAFELCKAIGERNLNKCYTIAEVFGNNPKKYPIQATLGAMFYYFNLLLTLHAHLKGGREFAAAAAKSGIFGPQRIAEYRTTASNFSLIKSMNIISLIEDCDYRSKSNAGGYASDGAMLNELLAKIFSL